MSRKPGHQIAVARKFWKFMTDNNMLLPTKTELRHYYMNTFKAQLEDSEAKAVPFNKIMWSFRSELRVVKWTKEGERENIIYRPKVAVDQNFVLRQNAKKKARKRETNDLAELKKKVATKGKKLSKDKGNIVITPACKANSEICIDVETKMLQLTVHNNNNRAVILRCVHLGSSSHFTVDDRIHKIVSEGKTAELAAKGKIVFVVQLNATNPGIYLTPVGFMFRFSDKDHTFHVVKYVKAEISDNIVNELQPTRKYVKPGPVAEISYPGMEIIAGEPPPMEPPRYKKPLQRYMIPPRLRDAMNHGKLETLSEDTFQGQLTAENHKETFTKLLHIEELQMEVDIKKYNMDDAQLVPKDGYLALRVPGLAENRPSLVRGDRLFVRQLDVNGNPEKKCYEGFVHQVCLNEVYLKFNKSFHGNFVKCSLYAVEFTFTRTSLKLMHRAVGLAPGYLSSIPGDGSPKKKMLADVIGSIRCYDQKIGTNFEQKQAVQNIVAGTSHPYPYLVFGPPGTGKTVTIVEAIKQVLNRFPNSFVLACAPSNNAADLILHRVSNHNVVPETKMVRLNAFGRLESSVDKKVQKFCKMSNGYYYLPPVEEIKKNYRLVVTTLITAGRFYSMGMDEGHFTHIFIDEAGHGTEPECLVAIAGLLGSEGQLVLAGDPKQLGPVLRSPIAIKHGLNVSFLERLMSSQFQCFGRQADNKYDARLVTKLLNNYRSHPAIIKLPNEMFYDNELRPCADQLQRNSLCHWNGLRTKDFPVLFEPVYGKDLREEKSPSFYNPQEVSVVLRFVKELKEARGIPLKMSEIGIISPYHKQVQKIRQCLQKKPYNINGIKVGSVEEFQGDERKVIIISTVRSSEQYLQMDAKFKLGFLKNPKRFNVAITRAKALLIVVGNPDVLCQDEHWREFIKYCSDNGSFGSSSSGNSTYTMPEVADDELTTQLERLNLNNENIDDGDDDDEGDEGENPEWRPPEE